jgi:hypothetical protein
MIFSTADRRSGANIAAGRVSMELMPQALLNVMATHVMISGRVARSHRAP